MVNMNVDEESNSVSQSARDQALKLENEKLKLEEELKEWLSILSKVVVYFLTIITNFLLYSPFLIAVPEQRRNGR